MRAHIGRGNRMPESTFLAIVRAIRGGQSTADAAADFGYTDRTVQRAASRDPQLRLALDAALDYRGRHRARVHGRTVVEPIAPPQRERVSDCDPGCCCDVCRAEQLLIARGFWSGPTAPDTPRRVPLSPQDPGGVTPENRGTAPKTEHDDSRTIDDATA